MIRLHVVAEGQTEEAFVKRILSHHLGFFDITTDVRCVQTSKKHGKKYRGGLRSYEQIKSDLLKWLKEDHSPEARFTTMIDLYGLPGNFPAISTAIKTNYPGKKVDFLEKAFADDIGDKRFIPYLQLHEFEALIFVDPTKLELEFIGKRRPIENLLNIKNQFPAPEDIDKGTETAPSKRIIKEIPEHEGRKASAGPRIVEAIGLKNICMSCKHFRNWLQKLEQLGK